MGESNDLMHTATIIASYGIKKPPDSSVGKESAQCGATWVRSP